VRAGSPRRRWHPATIRVRLGIALIFALAPVLVLGGLQSGLTFSREARVQRNDLAAAAERSAAAAQAKIEAGGILLETLAPRSIGFQCAPRLAEVAARLPGYRNLIRFDALGRVACSAASVQADASRRDRPWFQALARRERMVVSRDPDTDYGGGAPSLLAAVPALDPQGHFDGALAAVIDLASLRPLAPDPTLPAGSEVALADAAGAFISATRMGAFPAVVGGHLSTASADHAAVWFGKDRLAKPRVLAAAPLINRDVYVLISSPSQGLVGWAWVNPVSALALPLLAFFLALTAVGVVAERGVVRWIAYLQRIAAIYARGRFTVHPVKAADAPPEFRDLAVTLDAMASTILARDADLKDSLIQKDHLMREIHHRVKNNLQVISSLLNMQQRSLADPAARAAMSDTRQRIGALALIYRALYEGPDLKRVDLRDFLDELIAQLVTSEPSRAPIQTELVLDPLIIDPDRLAPLALFAVEAITNAKKHGLGATGGILRVTFTVRAERAELSIDDPGASARKPEVGQGVGRTLMTAFARQLRGEVSFCANAGGGLTVRLVFPTPATDDAGLAAAPA
jgi:two-component sensor histidine kinase